MTKGEQNMTQTLEEMRYQLEDWLAQGFTSPEDRANYQTLKEQYEDETFDYSFSKREITGQLELIITSRESDCESFRCFVSYRTHQWISLY